MLTGIEAVIFDVDGTLVDSMWIWSNIDELFLERFHLTKPENFHKGMEGMSYSETAQYFLELFPELPFTKEELERKWFELAYEIYAREIELKKGAYEFILEMHAKGIKLGIASSNHKKLAEAVLAHHKVLPYFGSVWTASEAGAGKPDPAVYLRVAEELNVDPSKCLVFEDVPNGIQAGKAAGMKVCAVEDPFSDTQKELKWELADYYIRDFDDIGNDTYDVLL